MTTTLNADTVVGGAVVTGDASGVLALQAAGNTGLTLNSSRAIGIGASSDYGNTGQLLTSAGSAAAPTWLVQGTTGQILTSAGSGAAPTWSTPSAGTAIGLVRAISINCILC